MFFLLAQLCNSTSRNFHYEASDAICDNSQYWESSFSDMFCLNCIFVFNAAVKQLVSGSFLKHAVSAVAMAAHKFFFKSNQIFTVLVSLNSLQYRSMVASGGVRPRVLALGQHRSEETSQRRRAVGYTVSDMTGLGIELQILRMDSDIFKTTQ